MPATLRVVREGVGIELRRGHFQISVDGKESGAIDRHETVEIPIEPGSHSIQIQAGRYSSHKQTFEAGEGEVVNFRTRGAVIWPIYVASIIKPDLAIALKRE